MTSFSLMRLLALWAVSAGAMPGATLVPQHPPVLWEQSEYRVEGAPVAGNNFDPDQIRLDATITSPTRQAITVPAFWFQEFTRALIDGEQVLAPAGEPHWRLRFTPTEAGVHRIVLTASVAGAPPAEIAAAELVVPEHAPVAPTGWVRSGADRRYLETSDGRPLRLIGANVCWGGARGTYNFDEWFAAMRAAGENFARLWFAPWSMGLEHKPGTLNRYDLAEAWQADSVLQRAGECGLYVLIAMDHHGMFMSNDPAWGGSNNFWTRSSPYAVENGGPCANPNEFFTRAEAHLLYQKRLRYLIARYGSNPRLVSWQFFNEIDNSYQPRSALVGADVVAWHQLMGRWLRAHDPYQHLVSTSLTGASDRPEYWTMPEMDFAVYHSYGEANPASHLAKLADDFVQRYQKPVMIGEFGTSAWGWNIAQDPYLRGFRQGLWGGTLGGSMGTTMPWWWESMHEDKVYPFYTVLRDALQQAGWNEGPWAPARFSPAVTAPPEELGEPSANGEPFTAEIALNQLRLNAVTGTAAIADPLAAARAAERVSSYLHGTNNPHLQQHAVLTAWFADRARLVWRVNSVAANAALFVRIDDEEKFRTALVNRDGVAVANDEINQEFSVDLPPGRHRVTIAHTGADWVTLKSLRLERVRPATFAGGWTFPLEPIGLRREDTVVIYLPSPHVAWPANALRYHPPEVRGGAITVTDWPTGIYHARWLDPKSGAVVASSIVAGHGRELLVPVPDFSEDLVAIVSPKLPAE